MGKAVRQPEARRAARTDGACGAATKERRRTPDVLYAIARWRELYFVRVPKEDAVGLMASVLYPQEFVKLYAGPSTAASAYFEQQRSRILESGGIELMYVAYELLRLAARSDRNDGRLVDHLGLPASLNAIAAACALSFDRVQNALRLLSSPRIAFLTRTPWRPSDDPVGPCGPARSCGKPRMEGAGFPGGDEDEACPGDGRVSARGDPESPQEAGSDGGGAGPPMAAGPVVGPTARDVAQQQPSGSQEQEQEQEEEQDKGETLAASCKLQDAAEKDESCPAPGAKGETRGGVPAREAEQTAADGGQPETAGSPAQGGGSQPPNGTGTGEGDDRHASSPWPISPGSGGAEGDETASGTADPNGTGTGEGGDGHAETPSPSRPLVGGAAAPGCQGVECQDRVPDRVLWWDAIADKQWSVAWPQVLGDPKGNAFGRLMWQAIGWDKRDCASRERHRQMGIFAHAWQAAAASGLPDAALLDLAEAAIRKARSIADQDRRKRQGIGVPWTDGPQQVWRTWWGDRVADAFAHWSEAVRVLPRAAP